MDFNDYIKINNDYLIKTTKKICGNHPDYMELYQFVVLQLLSKPPKKVIPDNQKMYYFIRLIKNNWFSSTSRYHYKFRRVVYNHKETNLEEERLLIKDEVYTEDDIPDMDWVRDQLHQYGWFYRDIFLLYIELNTIKAVSTKTTIPINSCSKYINEVKVKLQEDWINRCI
jgi:hypothetical protein